MKKTILATIITISVLLPIFAFEKNKQMPTVSLRDGDSKFYALNELKGKPMVLMAFNLACVYCDPEITFLMEQKALYGDALQVFLINADPLSRKEEVLEKTKKLNSNLPLLFDKNQDYTEGKSFPYTIIIDSKGVVKEVMTGFSEDTKKKMQKAISTLK